MASETQKDVKWFASRTIIGLAIAFLIVAAGTSIKNPWLVIPVTTILTAVGGYLAGKGDKKDKVQKAIVFGLIGLAASVGWLAFS